MRMTAVLVALAIVPMAAQSKPAKKPAEPPSPITMSGCVAQGSGTPSSYTLRDEDGTPIRKLTGLNLHDFIGKRVELVGIEPDSKRVKIKTGLLPNPNIAAQSGAIDQTQAATAAVGGSAPVGDVQLQEIRVKSVKPLEGGCR